MRERIGGRWKELETVSKRGGAASSFLCGRLRKVLSVKAERNEVLARRKLCWPDNYRSQTTLSEGAPRVHVHVHVHFKFRSFVRPCYTKTEAV